MLRSCRRMCIRGSYYLAHFLVFFSSSAPRFSFFFYVCAGGVNQVRVLTNSFASFIFQSAFAREKNYNRQKRSQQVRRPRRRSNLRENNSCAVMPPWTVHRCAETIA